MTQIAMKVYDLQWFMTFGMSYAEAAAQLAAERCAREALELGMRKVEAWIKGPGAGREAAIRSLRAAGLEVTAVKDCTPQPHNGCRPRKRRRV